PNEKPDLPAAAPGAANPPPAAPSRPLAAVAELLTGVRDQAAVAVPHALAVTIAPAVVLHPVILTPTPVAVYTMGGGRGAASTPTFCFDEPADPAVATTDVVATMPELAWTSAPESWANQGHWLQACDAYFANNEVPPAAVAESSVPTVTKAGGTVR